jgi:ubiquinone/menaquinone biosynthesis C-methylase UbiE
VPKEKKEHVDFQRTFFDQSVDTFKQPIPEEVIERSRRIVRSIVPAGPVRILDVGTGIGVFLRYYSECGVPFKNILGCDLSSQMLAEAKQRFPEVEFWQGDIIDLPARFGTFDLVVFNACFANIFDQLAVLKKSRSLLNEHGRVAITHPMGNVFVAQLKANYPELVFSLLPGRHTLEEWAKELDMALTLFGDEPEFYQALLVINNVTRDGGP